MNSVKETLLKTTEQQRKIYDYKIGKIYVKTAFFEAEISSILSKTEKLLRRNGFSAF